VWHGEQDFSPHRQVEPELPHDAQPGSAGSARWYATRVKCAPAAHARATRPRRARTLSSSNGQSYLDHVAFFQASG
jgi:hypothetical protein